MGIPHNDVLCKISSMIQPCAWNNFQIWLFYEVKEGNVLLPFQCVKDKNETCSLDQRFLGKLKLHLRCFIQKDILCYISHWYVVISFNGNHTLSAKFSLEWTAIIEADMYDISYRNIPFVVESDPKLKTKQETVPDTGK